MAVGAESTSESGPDAARPNLHLSETSGSYELVLSAVIFGIGGLFLDRWLGTTPLFLLIFTIAGLVGATSSIYYRYKHRIAQIQAETEALKAAHQNDASPSERAS